MSRLSFFTELSIFSRQSEYAYHRRQRKTLKNECHQNERKGQKDDEASLRKRASVVEGEWQGVGSGQRDNTTHASPSHDKNLVCSRPFVYLLHNMGSHPPRCGRCGIHPG